MNPVFFAAPLAFRAWLEEHHSGERELWVGLHRRESGRPSLTWPESVDEALCFGWIDGVRKRIDETSYVIRFTPRKATSNWSAVNIGRMEELIREGRVRPAGLAAFARRSEAPSGVSSYEERKHAKLDEPSERRFREQEGAWRYFAAQPPGYRRTSVWWVVSAKREETRQKRLSALIEASAAGEPIAELRRAEPRKREKGG